MYGRSSPVRPCASCTVATPCWPSVRITSESARRMLRTIVGFIQLSVFSLQSSVVSRQLSLVSRQLSLVSCHLSVVSCIFESCVDPRVHLADVPFEDPALRAVVYCRGVDVALRIVVVVARLRIDAANGADHLRTEEDVVCRHHLEQQVDARLVVHAG